MCIRDSIYTDTQRQCPNCSPRSVLLFRVKQRPRECDWTLAIMSQRLTTHRTRIRREFEHNVQLREHHDDNLSSLLFFVGVEHGFGTGRPVSYTHLRAHETPEHLVCRLLL